MTPEEKRHRNREAGRRYYEKHRERDLERQRKWREKNLELKRKIMRDSARRRRVENPEKTRAIQRNCRANESPEQRANRLAKIRQWHLNHQEEIREWWRNYRQKPHFKEKERIRSKNRKAWYRQAVGSFSADDIAALYERQNGKCAHCGCVFPQMGTHRFQIDHIIPLKPAGALIPRGTNNPENLQLLCQKCNRAKSNHLLA